MDNLASENKALVVISDLHVGRGDEFDIFASRDKPLLFETFLDHYRDIGSAVELVINGDFIDFLQLRPWNDLSRGTALLKLKEILNGSPHVFLNLGRFLHKTRHEIKIILGNHDVELAYPEVGAELSRAILKHAPDAAARLSLVDRRTTYNVKVNDILIHIEHGNGGDPWNSVDYETIFLDAEQEADHFTYPPGTRFVYKIMNDFKQHFRFVDLLKPEVPAVPLLLLSLQPLAVANSLPESLKVFLTSLKNGFLAKLRERIYGPMLGQEMPLLSSSSSLSEDLLAQTCAETATLEGLEIYPIEQYLNGDGAQMVSAGTLGSHLGLAKLKLILWALKGLARFKAQREGESFYSHDYPQDPAAKGARSRFNGQVRVVIFGHTHEALKTEFSEGLYINSGTWANLIRMPNTDSDSLLKWYQQLATNTFEITFDPTFVQIEPTQDGALVSLNRWSHTGTNSLWQKVVAR
jgi:UDP-2,3-diacylglucosamine pyrophosphatase LpxH